MMRLLFLLLIFLSGVVEAGPGTRAALVGTWRTEQQIDNVAVVSEITLTDKGTFHGFLDKNGKRHWNFAGTWILSGEWLHSVYTQSDLAITPVGRKDRDKIIEVSKEYWRFEGSDGSAQVYMRVAD